MAEQTMGAPELAELTDEFDVQAEIGRGGTAVVYLARERSLDRRVAIKIIRGRYAGDDELVARLEREARLVARLAHPNVVGLHSVRRLRHGSLALVMQYVQGRTLRDELRRRGALAAPRARRVLGEVARALAAAHAHGIVHRDVKPENIHLVHETGRVLLGDFGSATPLDADNRLTIPGMTIGTPGYMAPELVDGGAATPAADLYSLGLVGWEMLAGQLPWSGTTLFEVLAFRKHGQLAPIDSLRADVPAALAHAIERATQADPAERWESAAALVAALGVGDEAHDVGDMVAPAGTRRPTGPPLRWTEAAAAAPNVPTVRFVRPRTEGEPAPPPDVAAPQPPRDATAVAPAVPAPAAPITLADAIVADEPDDGEATHDDAWDEPPVQAEPPRWRRAVRRAAVVMAIGGTAAAAAFVSGIGRTSAPSRQLAPDTDVAPRREVPIGDAPASAAITPAARTPPAQPPPASVLAAAGIDDSTPPATAAAPTDSATGAPSDQAPDPAPPRSETVVTAPPPARPAARETAADRMPDVASERAGRVALAPAPADVSPRTSPSEPAAPQPDDDAGEAAGALAARGISVGGMHSCAVLASSKVLCWGSNDHGQLGSRGGARQVRAVPITAGLQLHGLALGLAHSCGLTSGGTALCWGSNDHGQLGIGAASETSVPSRVAGGTRFTALAVGAAHSCGLDGDGVVLCWGGNDDGQLGTGDTDDRHAPTRVDGDGRFRSIAAGWNHSCAIATDGRGFCWGSNDDGQLGVGGGARRSPTPIGTSETLRAMAAGSAHSCALTTGGDVLCWGRNRDGQLGDGTRTGSRTPHRVTLPGDAVAIAAGTVHSCALLRTGDVYCWGQNRYGQLGDGTTIDRTTPIRVATSLPFAAIAASGAHSCGITTGGATLCWGYNLDGQLGDGTRDNRARPVPVRAGGGE